MHIRFLKPGMLTTIQDMGRQFYLSHGVPVSGAMDTLSMRLANITLGNDANAAVIEFTYGHASFKAETGLLIAYCGGGVLRTNDGGIPRNRPVFIPEGSIVTLDENTYGCRTYLAVAGGWDVPEILSSRSTYVTAAIGGPDGRQLLAGDVLGNMPPSALSESILARLKGGTLKSTNWAVGRELLVPANQKTVRVILANGAHWFESASLTDFLSAPYTLSKRSNRMGYQLEGPDIKRAVIGELLSAAVTPGTIQVTGSGGLVLLMADCQTTGGYPRIAQVAAADLPLCGQLKPGDTVFFKEISRREAEFLYINREKQLQRLAIAVGLKYL